MKDLWDRFEVWLKKNEPKATVKLRPPAKEADILAAEKTMGLKLPEDFRASLLVHDGQEDHDGNGHFAWMPGCDRLAPLKAIVEQWKDEQDRKQDDEIDDAEILDGGRFRNVLWHSKRIPIAGSPWWDGDNTYLDLVPGPKGTVGQLVTMVTECDFEVMGPSFRAAFEGYVSALEDGTWAKTKVTGHTASAFVDLMKKRSKPAANGTPKSAKAPAKKAKKKSG